MGLCLTWNQDSPYAHRGAKDIVSLQGRSQGARPLWSAYNPPFRIGTPAAKPVRKAVSLPVRDRLAAGEALRAESFSATLSFLPGGTHAESPDPGSPARFPARL
jgi:hypothetical protein